MTARTSKPAHKKSLATQGNTGGNAGAASLPPKSEGQRLLLTLSDSLSVIARAAGNVDRSTVLRWQRGRRPDPEARRNLRAAYGIPIEAWEQSPAKEPATEHHEHEESKAEADAPANSAAHFLELIRDIRRIKRELSPSEQLKAIKDEGALRSLYERALDKVARDWDRIIRESPQWVTFSDALMRALDKHPAAKADVLEVLERMGP